MMARDDELRVRIVGKRGMAYIGGLGKLDPIRGDRLPFSAGDVRAVAEAIHRAAMDEGCGGGSRLASGRQRGARLR